MIGPRVGVFSLVLLGGVSASAATPDAPTPTPSGSADSDHAPAQVPLARDMLGGHLLFSASPLVLFPVAYLDNQNFFPDVASVGLGLAADLSLGVSRSVDVGAWFQFVSFTEPSDCGGCKTSTYALGPAIRYHLAQGVRFDSWLSLGAGYRKLQAFASGPKSDYHGIDWLKLDFGGDWYALSQFAFGPYAEFDFGTFTHRPAGDSPSVYGLLGGGIRVTFDARGK